MEFTMYTSSSTGQASNCYYPNQTVVRDRDEFKQAVSLDHVAASFRQNYRSNQNFLSSDHICLDCDNESSDDPEDWISPEDILRNFDGVSLAIATSKSHMKTKGSQSARPRFHVYFPIEEIRDANEYADLKAEVASLYPFFDSNALDSARFMFGNPNSTVYWQSGVKLITDFVYDAFAEWDDEQEQIPEGSRNATLSHYAGRIIIRLGDTDEAHEKFMAKADLCNPPLPLDELDAIWNSARRFGQKVASQEGYIPPEDYGKEFTLMPTDFSDVGQATVLTSEYGDILRYSPATNYLCYNGSFWEESEPLAQELAQKLTERQLDEAELASKEAIKEMNKNGASQLLLTSSVKKAESSFNDGQRNSYRKFQLAEAYKKYVIKRRDSRYISSALKEARPMMIIDPKDLDHDAFLLNTPSFTYDLREGLDKALPHQAEDLITNQTLVDPSDKGDDIWKAALEVFFLGDQDVIDYVQQVAGIAAIGKIVMEAMIIAYGDGRNGKSTFWNAILRVLGTYADSMSADVLTVGSKRNVKPELAEVRGKRLIIAAELEEGMRLSTSVVKQLCSTDDIRAEKKYKDPFSFTPSHTIVLYTNHLPKVGALDQGTWRRLIVIPFEAVIEGSKDIKNYADHLVSHAGGAILSWIIEGAKKVIKNDFILQKPDKIVEASQQYREENNWLERFIDECCEVDPSFTEKSGEFYASYRAFCARTGDYTRSTTDFYSAIANAGYDRRKNSKGSFIYGIKLRDDYDF